MEVENRDIEELSDTNYMLCEESCAIAYTVVLLLPATLKHTHTKKELFVFVVTSALCRNQTSVRTSATQPIFYRNGNEKLGKPLIYI